MNQFIWTDLSTYSLKESVEFYRALFEWEFEDRGGYFIGYKGFDTYVGLYETPAFFKKIGMPHFWMNYVQVADVKDVVEKAKLFHGKVEIEKEAFYDGRIALIRDPMGAGFTIYDGTQLNQGGTVREGAVVSRELHTSDAHKVVGFYQELFNWTIDKQADNVYQIVNTAGQEVGKIVDVKNEVKGTYEYWVTTFWVKDLNESLKRIVSLGGRAILHEGHRILVTDKFGEAFFYIESFKNFAPSM